MIEERNEYGLKEVYTQMRSVISQLASENGMEVDELFESTAKALDFELSFLNLNLAFKLQYQMREVLLDLLSTDDIVWTSDKKLRCATLR